MMADEQETEQAQEPAEGEPDYRELYEQAKAASRKWERQAKANRGAADELARAQEAGKTAEERIAELTRRLDEQQHAAERAKAAAKVAEAKGVPTDLIIGDTVDEMEAWADRMLEAFGSRPAPVVSGAGSFAADKDAAGDSLRDFTRRLLDQE